jgi:hypothetical protein
MNDKDFDKLFNDHLREDLNFPFDDKDWEKLAHRLDNPNPNNANPTSNRSAFWRQLLLGMLLLLLLMNAWQLWRSSAQTRQNEALLNQFSALEARLSTPLHTRDTVFVSRTDTVFLTKTVTKYVKTPANEALLTSNLMPSTQELARDNKVGNAQNRQYPPSVKKESTGDSQQAAVGASVDNSKSNTPQPSSPNFQILPPSVKNDVPTENPQITSLIATIKSLENKIQQLDSQLISSKNNNLNSSTQTADSIKKMASLPVKKQDSTQHTPLSISEPLSRTTPQTKRVFVGVNGGLINYAVKWFSAQGVEIGKKEQSYQVGLKAEYALTDRLRVVVGGDFCPFKFQTFWRDNRYNLPEPQPTTWERYNSATARQELVQGFGGIKYMLSNGRNKWRPFAEVAYASMLIRPFKTTYEYQNKTTYALRTETVQSSKQSIGKLLMGSGGVEYRFGKKWVSQAEAFYYYDLNRPRRTYDLFGVRGAVYFNF